MSNIKITTEECIERFKKVHGDKYDYSKVKYIDSKTDVIIICPIHGEFKQKPNKHYNHKQNCPKCAKINTSKKLIKNTEWFINKAKEIHGDKYDYSKVKYVGTKDSVTIICPIHGEFEQIPNDHLSKHGCPKCGNVTSFLENSIEKLLMDNNIEFNKQKTFDWLKYKKNLKLDFYLPQYNVAIECQGKQHFGIGNWKNENTLILERDYMKNELCKKYGIKLLYFTNIKNFDKENILPIYENLIYDYDTLLKEIKMTIK